MISINILLLIVINFERKLLTFERLTLKIINYQKLLVVITDGLLLVTVNLE